MAVNMPERVDRSLKVLVERVKSYNLASLNLKKLAAWFRFSVFNYACKTIFNKNICEVPKSKLTW